VQALTTAAELDPQAQTLLKLARVQRKNPIWGGRVLETLQRAVQLDPRCAEVWLELAEIWQRRGQAERQRKALESALKADPYCEPAARAYATAFGERELQKLLRGLA